MRSRDDVGEGAAGTAPSSVERSVFESASTVALEQTLAIPTHPQILDAQLLAQADTLELRPHADVDVSAERQPHSDGALREPVTGNQFSHAYDTDEAGTRELGRGGIGRVVLVFDRTLGRDVAMKELLPELLTVEQSRDRPSGITLTQRFLREARITGQLEHPNIVPVYELGRQPSGCLYYTMRVVRGRTLASAVQQATTLTQRLSLVNHFAGLCQAIAYAHSRGVVHRDIKPENVMIGEFGETFVLDWGLANIVEESSPLSLRAAASLSCPPKTIRRSVALAPGTADSNHTQFGSIVGTPMYMSPEQLLQRSDGCTPTADVWSLGVVLYNILTGKLPFVANNLGELILKIQSGKLQPIEVIAPDVPRDLAAISRRALTQDPAARYQNARELARDITAYQAGEKVAAYEYSSLELLRRYARRNRPSLIVAAAAVATLLTLGASSYRRIAAARDTAVAAEHRAMLGEQRAKTSLSDVLLERARTELSEGDPANATVLAAGSLELLERPDARGMLIALENSDRLESLQVPELDPSCECAAWNTSLGRLACSHGQKLTLFDGTKIQNATLDGTSPIHGIYSIHNRGWLVMVGTGLWGIHGESPQIALRRPSLPPISVFASAPNGENFATVDAGGTVAIWDTESVSSPKSFRPNQPITAVAFHPTERYVALGGHHGDLYLWKWSEEPQPNILGNAHSTVRALAFKSKSNQLASGGSDGAVLVWDTYQHQLSHMPLRASSAVVGLSYSPTGGLLAVSLRSGLLEILDTSTYERSLRSATGYSSVGPIVFASKSDLLGIAEGKSPLHFRIRKAEPAPHYTARGNVLSLTWAPNGTDLLVAGLGEHGLCHLRLTDGTCGDRLPLRTALVRAVAHSDDNALFAVGGSGGKVEIWDSVQKLPRGFLEVPIPEVRSLVFLPGTHLLAVGGNAPTLVILDLDRMQTVTQEHLSGPVHSMAYLRNLQQLAIGMRSGQVLFRSTKDGSVHSALALASGWPIGMAVLDRQGWLAIAEDNGRLAFFDSGTKKLLHAVTVGSGRMTAFGADTENGLVAIGGEDREIFVVSTAPKPNLIARLQDHQGTIRSLLFDPVKHRLFSSGDDATIRLWSLKSLNTEASTWLKASERDHGMHLESGRIVRQPKTATP